MTTNLQVVIFWTADATGQSGGLHQPFTWAWPPGHPLPEVGDRLQGWQGSPLDGHTVEVLTRTWTVGLWDVSVGGPALVLRLDCEWVQ